MILKGNYIPWSLHVLTLRFRFQVSHSRISSGSPASCNVKGIQFVNESIKKVSIFNIIAGLILGLRPANEGCRYKVMLSLIGWVQT